MSVVEAVQAEIHGLPNGLGESGLAALALACAENVEASRPGSASGAMWAMRLQESLRELRALAPPKRQESRIDELTKRRNDRLSAAEASVGP